MIAAAVSCLLYAYINGFHDASNVISTIVVSRSLAVGRAIFLACAAQICGVFLLGTGVAATMGRGVVRFDMARLTSPAVIQVVVLAAMGSAILWNLATWILRMPSSSSHALVGGLTGASLMAFGPAFVDWNNLLFKVVLVLFASPPLGFLAGWVGHRLLVRLVRDMHPRINHTVKRLQTAFLFLLAMSQSSNDVQKSTGLLAALLLYSGLASSFTVPWWATLCCAALFTLGFLTGGTRILRTVGRKIYDVRPIHSLSAQISACSIIVISSVLGGPVSSTQIINAAIVGVGSAERKNAVNWQTVKRILVSWAGTIPAAAAIAALLTRLLMLIVGEGLADVVVQAGFAG